MFLLHRVVHLARAGVFVGSRIKPHSGFIQVNRFIRRRWQVITLNHGGWHLATTGPTPAGYSSTGRIDRYINTLMMTVIIINSSGANCWATRRIETQASCKTYAAIIVRSALDTAHLTSN